MNISGVSVSATTFNPSRGDSVELRYHLSRSTNITVTIFDPDFERVQILTDKVHREAGAHREIWDGRDVDGAIVPNEAYFFTVEAEDKTRGQQAVYDPITFSGGEPFGVTEFEHDQESQRLRYELSQPSRVLIRIGIPGHALLKTLVDWKPRVGGKRTEHWNGSDDRVSAERRTREFDNEEFIHFWDEELLAGLLWQRILGRREVPWDVYLLYNADAQWETDPAKPDFFRRRLNRVNQVGLELKLKKMLRQME